MSGYPLNEAMLPGLCGSILESRQYDAYNIQDTVQVTYLLQTLHHLQLLV